MQEASHRLDLTCEGAELLEGHDVDENMSLVKRLSSSTLAFKMEATTVSESSMCSDAPIQSTRGPRLALENANFTPMTRQVRIISDSERSL